MSKKLKSIIVSDLTKCIECGKNSVQIHHCLYGNKRKQCDEDALVVPLCHECHRRLHDEDGELANKYKKIAQAKYEEKHTREEYLERYGKSYL